MLPYLRLFSVFWISFFCLIFSREIFAQSIVVFSLDTITIHYRIGDPQFTTDTVKGSIRNLTSNSISVGLKLNYVSQWVLQTEVEGNVTIDESIETVKLAPDQTVPVLIFIQPFGETPDTENACFTVVSLKDSAVIQEHCVPLYVGTKGQLQDSLVFLMDTTPIHYQPGQPVTTDTVHGAIQNLSTDSLYFNYSQSTASQWISGSEIKGNHILTVNHLPIAPQETIPFLIRIMPYPELPPPDSQAICVTVVDLKDSSKKELCISLYMEVASGVNLEPSQEGSTMVYPNPFSMTATITLTDKQASQNFSVKIVNDAGKEVTNNFEIKIYHDSITVERKNAPSGTYFYRLQSKVSSQPSSIIGTGKFIIQ